MIQPRHGLIDCRDRRHGRIGRSPQQDHGYTQRSRRRDLAIRSLGAAVLGYDDIDGMGAQQGQLRCFLEWAPTLNIESMRNRQRRFDRIHAAYQVAMLRRRDERGNLLPSQREEHVPRFRAQSPNGILRVLNFNPAIALNGGPRRTPQREDGRMRLNRRARGVSRNSRRVRMSRIDQGGHCVVPQILNESDNSPEAAAPHGHGLCRGRRGTARQRQGDAQSLAGGEMLTQQPGFRSASKNQDMLSHVAR